MLQIRGDASGLEVAASEWLRMFDGFWSDLYPIVTNGVLKVAVLPRKLKVF